MPTAFKRTSLTWLMYSALSTYGYFLNGLGPITPFLKDELHLSYTVGSLHFTAFACGMVAAGLGGHWLIRRLGRRNALWLGLFGLALGGAGLALGRIPLLTVSACLLMGSLGSLVLSICASGLSDHYAGQDENRSVALTEANMVASVFSVVPPLLVGWFVQSGAGWRMSLWVALLIVVGLWAGFGKVTIPEEKPAIARGGPRSPLPVLFWAYWAVLLLAVSVEFCMVSWSVDFIEKGFNLARAEAAQALSIFLAGMIVGRWSTSLLVQRFRVVGVISASLLTAGLGFAFYWLAPLPWLSLAGLLITGLGVAPLYPLILSLAMRAAGENTDIASARTTLASGSAIFALPLLLGGLADSVGIHAAYAVVPVLLVCAFAMLQLAGWVARGKVE